MCRPCLFENLSELFGTLKGPVLPVDRIDPVDEDCPGDSAASLDVGVYQTPRGGPFPLVLQWTSGIYHANPGILEVVPHPLGGGDQVGIRPGHEFFGRDLRILVAEIPVFVHPLGNAPIQDSHLGMTKEFEDKEQACRKKSSRVVVGDDPRVLIDPELTEESLRLGLIHRKALLVTF